jgi:hypothetical protein
LVLPAKAHDIARWRVSAPQCAIMVQGPNLKNMSASANIFGFSRA